MYLYKEIEIEIVNTLGDSNDEENNHRQSNTDSFIQGFIATGKFAVLTRIPEEAERLIIDHFIEQGKSVQEAKSMSSSGPWWHVVDGGHINGGLVLSILEFSEKFGGFKWPVVNISWQSGDTLRAISRMCNEIQKDGHLIDFTLPEAMQNLRDIMDTHSKRQGLALIPGQKVRTGFIKEVMGMYSGSSGFSDNTMRSVCGIVVKLSSTVIKGMRILLTEECDEYCRSLGSNRPFGEDTRVCKKLISSQSLKGVKTFLNHSSMVDEDRLNVIHRLRFLARERETFKAFSSAEIERQCCCVLHARAEVSRFQQFSREDSWPPEMENLKRDMLRTTLFDQDISDHVVGDGGLLSCMVDAYIKATGTHGTQKVRLFRRCVETGAIVTSNAAENYPARHENGSNECSTPQTDGDGLIRNGELPARNEVADHAVRDQVDEVSNRETDIEAQDPNLSLEECGIRVYNQTLLDFERQSFDLGRAIELGAPSISSYVIHFRRCLPKNSKKIKIRIMSTHW